MKKTTKFEHLQYIINSDSVWWWEIRYVAYLLRSSTLKEYKSANICRRFERKFEWHAFLTVCTCVAIVSQTFSDFQPNARHRTRIVFALYNLLFDALIAQTTVTARCTQHLAVVGDVLKLFASQLVINRLWIKMYHVYMIHPPVTTLLPHKIAKTIKHLFYCRTLALVVPRTDCPFVWWFQRG